LRYPLAFHADVLTGWRYRADSMSGPTWLRPLMWRLYALPVLGAHATRCESDEDRKLVARRIERINAEIVGMARAKRGGGAG
jgi:hypothetical protein